METNIESLMYLETNSILFLCRIDLLSLSYKNKITLELYTLFKKTFKNFIDTLVNCNPKKKGRINQHVI